MRIKTVYRGVFPYSLALALGASQGLFLNACKSRADQGRVKIVDGKKVLNGDFPSVVRIYTQDPQNPLGSFDCTATWVSDRTIITAAHCVEDQPRDASKISIGDGTGSGAKGTKVHIFPTYRPHQSVGHDIAVVEFPQNTSRVFSALAVKQASPGDSLTIVGYGRFDHKNENSRGTKRFGTNKVTGIDGDGRINFEGKMSPVAGSEGTGESVTNSPGDSGGPMFINKRLAGVSSSVTKNPGDPSKLRGMYESVRHGEIEAWLKGLAASGTYMIGLSAGTETIETTDQTVNGLSGLGPGPLPSPVPDDGGSRPSPNPNPIPTPSPTPNPNPAPSVKLDCNKDYVVIREGGSGVCRNSSSQFCYRYSNGNVQYDLGRVNCGSSGDQDPVPPSGGGSGTPQPLDCNKDYTVIREGASGVCVNRSSGSCYRYSGGDVRYNLGSVRCP